MGVMIFSISKRKTSPFLISCSFVCLLVFGACYAFPSFAQTPLSISGVEELLGFDEEGLGDEDVTIDLEAEALPTVNKFGYLW